MPDPANDSPDPKIEYSPLFIHARREMWGSLAGWFAFGIWVLGVSWWLGAQPPDDPNVTPTVLGMPRWVFWGVAMPWVAANLFTFWFSFRFMVDDDLESSPDESGMDQTHEHERSRAS